MAGVRRLLLITVLLSLLTAVPAAEAAKRCGPKRPAACLPKRLPPSATALERTLGTPPRGHRSRKAERLARRLARRMQPPATAARAAQDESTSTEFTHKGLDVTAQTRERRPSDEVSVRDDLAWQFEARDRTGAGYTMGRDARHATPRCPSAVGAVPARYDEGLVVGRAVSIHGTRKWETTTFRIDGTWQGTVGAAAKAERFDVDLRGVLEKRAGVEIAATGKVLERKPTRTFRTALTMRGLKVGTAPASLAHDVRMRAPRGQRLSRGDEEQAMSALLVATLNAVGDIDAALEQGDRRWFDERACATRDFDASPALVGKGGQADWDVRVAAADGTPVATAIWTSSSACGSLAAPASGAPAHFTVHDSASAWGPNPERGACVRAEATTPAGRTPVLEHAIPPAPLLRRRFAFSIWYGETMGMGITPTDFSGKGEITIGGDQEYVEGTGTYSGSEWDQRFDNTCGQDMGATRTFAGDGKLDVQRNDDGTYSLGFTAVERPWRFAWIVVVPPEGGTRVITSRKPFCGTPESADTKATITVVGSEVP
jgi:hypothetical protein